MKKQKTPQDVRGFQIRCVNFVQCPICYGCRNFDFRDMECLICKKDSKMNLCNTKTHKPDLVAKMLTRNVVDFGKSKDKNETINFKSYNE